MKKSPQRLSDFHKGQILTEGLILVREDICDWITELIGGPPISGDSFLTTLQTGVVLCDLVRMIYDCVPPPRPPRWPPVAPWPQRKALRASFHARENISLFLNWCRAIGMKDTILFETRGLNDADEEKNIVLTLLHLGEICTDFDMPVPQFARFYKEMMTAKSTRLPLGRSTYALSTDTSDLGSMESGSISARSESNLFDSDLSNSWQLEAEDKVSRIPTAGGQRMAQKRTSTTAADIINGRMSGKSFDKLMVKIFVFIMILGAAAAAPIDSKHVTRGSIVEGKSSKSFQALWYSKDGSIEEQNTNSATSNTSLGWPSQSPVLAVAALVVGCGWHLL